MSYTDTFRSVPYISANEQDVPVELQSSVLRRPIPSSVSTIAINSSTGEQSSGGFSTIQVPTGMATGAIKPSSVYLRFTVSATVGGGGTWAFRLPAGSCASAVRQVTVTLGGQTVEQINQYGVYHNELLLHATNRNYLEGDAAIMEGASLVSVTRATGTDYHFVMPLALGVFNSSRGFPLYLLNGSPLQVQIDWETFGNACLGTGGAVSAITIKNVQLVMDMVNLDDTFKQAVKMRMADPQAPALFQLEYDTVLANRVANSSNINLNLGLNSSSIKGLLYTVVDDGAAGTAIRAFKYDGANNAYLYLDGRQVNNINIDIPQVAYVEANKALGLAFTPELSYGASAVATAVADTTALTTYQSTYFLGGINTTRFNSQGNAMVGCPCTSAQIVRSLAGNHTASSNFYYFFIMSMIMAIDATGNITLIR